jgi:DNA-binding transcriptional ArsR family regulator
MTVYRSIEKKVAGVASVIAEPSRAAMIAALMDGRLHPASELAYMAGIKPQTASFHLAKMSELKLVTMEKAGRHRYYKLNPDVAEVMESLLVISPPAEIKSFKHAAQTKAIKQARTCYDHFAGEFGVDLTDCLVTNGWILEGEKDFLLTKKGEECFYQVGINISELRKKKRQFSRKCLDWSERKYHLAGSLGKSLVMMFHELKWIEPVKGSRAIKITNTGRKGLKDHFMFELS